MLQLIKRQISTHKAARKEVSEAHFIPYYCHWDSRTLMTKKNEIIQIVKLGGYPFETADDEIVDMKKMLRNSLFKNICTGEFSMWFHVVRRRYSVYPEGEFQNPFARVVNEQWKYKHLSRDNFINELYITLIRKPDTKGAAKVEHWFKSMYHSTDKLRREMQAREDHKELCEATYRIVATLKDFDPRVLQVVKTEEGVFSEPLEFLGMLVNFGIKQPILVPSIDISHYLPNHRPYFGTRAIEARGIDTQRYASMISIKDYSPSTNACMMDSFLKLPFEFIISQSFESINPRVAIEKMTLQQMRMRNAKDKAVSQMEEITEAMDYAMSGHVGYGEHHFTVMPLADTLSDMEENTSMALAELLNQGIDAVRETINMEAVFWAQLPANSEYIARKAIVNTLNLASFASNHNYSSGKANRNHWGPAVTVLQTAARTPYFFNFHLRDVGHTTIIGPTGAGKTVLMNFLCAQAQKFNCRTFLFDKDRGSEIFVRAINGKYSVIRPGKQSMFNPLQLPDTQENRSFLTEWLIALVSIHGEAFTSQDMDRINDAVRGTYKLSKEDRKLSNIAPFLGLQESGSVASRLKMWYGEGAYARLFDNDEDSLNFNTATTFGFEMGDILQDKMTLGPVLLYLFHKIQLALDGTPTLIVLDEAWALIDNDIFAPKIRNWLKTLRKLNAMVIFATQSVEDAGKSNISDTLIQQTATQIFLPNPKATEMYREAFMVGEREFQLLKSMDPGARAFLIKQGEDVVVARLNLMGMDDVINILSGRADTVAVLDEIRKEVGDDPDVWIPLFCERLRRRSHA